MIGTILPGLVSVVLGAVIGWALVRWTNIAIARLWAIALLLVFIVLLVLAMIFGGSHGIRYIVLATLVVLPGLIGSVFGMIATEWRTRDQ